jgi:translocation and assembly module TamB
MSGQLGFSGRPDNPVLYGRVKIKKALYDKKINFSSFLLSYKRYSAVTQSSPVSLINPRLNVKVVSKKKIEIRNNIINTNFSADMNILGTLDNPVIIGTANAEKGGIFFRGTELKLSYANLDFNNRYKINPTFDVAARTYINQYMIRMNASGSMLNFNVNLSSTPPLSELSIVSMLALGTTANSVYASSAGGIAASEAASAIGGGVEQSVTGTISSYFGFKNMSVAPGYSSITHSAAPQVTVSKNLTKRLSVSYSDIASSQSSQSATITYTLTPHISVIGVWENNELAPNNSNVYSEVGGNIVFHFRFY